MGGLSTINLSGERVASVGNGTSDLSTVGSSIGEHAVSNEVVRAAGSKVVELGGIEVDLDGLAGRDSLESRLVEASVGDAKTDTLEVESAAYANRIRLPSL